MLLRVILQNNKVCIIESDKRHQIVRKNQAVWKTILAMCFIVRGPLANIATPRQIGVTSEINAENFVPRFVQHCKNS